MTDEVRLLPCPFCGKAMQLREALWPSEGDTDAVMHAEATECPVPDFSVGSVDRCTTVIDRWNALAATSEAARLRALLAPGQCAMVIAEEWIIDALFTDPSWDEQFKREVREVAATALQEFAAAAVQTERDACAQIAASWQGSGKLLLAAGEMTAQELRTAKAIAAAIERAIRARSEISGIAPPHVEIPGA